MKHKMLSDGRIYYSSKDLARIFSVNESTIKRWADSGKLSCFRTVGNHRRFPLDMVMEFVSRYNLQRSLPLNALKEIFPQ
jgi:excisionase family DNA binding protein